jgi:hypothetical protein
LIGLAFLIVAVGLGVYGIVAALASSNAPAADRSGGPGGTDGTSTTLGTAPTTTVPPYGPPLTQPTAAQPLRILQIGDSLGEDLGFGMSNELARIRHVHFFPAAYGDSGLANTSFYNWPVHLRSELASDHPQVVVVFLGGNDSQGFDVNGQPVLFATAAWRSAYTARVATMMNEALSAWARVVWVGMPAMDDPSDPSLSGNMALLDSIYRHEVTLHRGTSYLSAWRVLGGPGGSYRASITTSSGQVLALRQPDGVHLAPTGENMLAAAVVAQIERLYHVKLAA